MKDKNTITLNGKISTQITGLLIQELPPISKPLLRSEKEEIDGRDGDIITPLGYSSYNKEITIGLYGEFDIDEVISYFNSNGTVIFSNEPDKYYNYQILDQIDFERLVRYKTATVTFHVQPFKYAAFEGDLILDPPAENLITMPDFNQTTNGVTLSVTDNIVSVTGNPTAATEIYLPIDPLSLSAGTYELSATSSGTNPNNCSIRLIGSAPSNADSLGGKYIALAEGTVTLQGTLSAAKTFNYLWFYINPGQTFNFTATFELENQAEKVASGEGSTLALINTTEAPFSRFDIKGNTYQLTYSGKNKLSYTLAQIQSINSGSAYTWDGNKVTHNGITYTINDDLTISASGTASGASFLVINNSLSLDSNTNYIMTGCPSNGSTSTYSLRLYAGGSYTSETGNGINFTFTNQTLVRVNVSNGTTVNNTVFKPMIRLMSMTDDSYEPYVGGVPAPNPDNPQEIQVVKHQDMVRLTGKNLVNVDELYLPSGITRTSEGLQTTITASTLATYYSGSVANPVGVYTVSFDGRIVNADEATLVLNTTASIWGESGLTLNDEDGNAADLDYRTLSADWKKYSFTVVAITSEAWLSARAMTLQFATYTNSPVFELRHFQIEAGITATEYDISRTQMYPINFRTGKNMLSVDFLSMGSLSSGNPDPTIKYRVQNSYAPLGAIPNTPYTISAVLGSTVKGMMVQVQECDANTLFLRSSDWQQLASGAYTFTTGSDTQMIKLVFALSTTNTTVTEGTTENTTEYNTPEEWLRGATIQVEAGDTATSFEAYESMELCKIGNHQDYLSKSGDDWYVHKEVNSKTFDGSESWTYNQAKSMSYSSISDIYRRNIHSNRFSVTNYYTNGEEGLWANPTNTDYGFLINNQYFYIRNKDCANAANLKTWLSSHNTILYYPLATPTDTKITNEETIAQLNYLNSNVHAYKEVTFISSLPGGTTALPPIIVAEVPMSSDGVVTNAGNFPAKPKLTIYGTGNIGVSLNGIQIFQIALGDEGYITIDTAAMEAYQDSTDNLKNRLVVGDYDTFTLNPGENSITFSGVVTKCIIENYSRWL